MPARVARAKWHTPRVPLGLCASQRLCAAAASAATALGRLPHARPAGTPIVLALTATHPTLGGARVALGASLVDRAALACLARAQPGGRFNYNAADGFTAGLTARGARLVPVLADPEHLAGELLANGPLRRRLAVRLSVALRALGARGIVLDWRDLPPAARGQYPIFVHELRVELGQAAQIVVTVPPVRTLIALKRGSYDLRALSRPARLLVLAWNEHGPRSEPGPGRLAGVLEADAAHRAACRAALARADGRADLGLAVERP